MADKQHNDFDISAREYDTWYEENRSAYLSELLAVKTACLNTGRALEIGVGTGRFAAPLGVKWGIDPARGMLKIARKRGCRVIQGAGELLPFRDLVFQCVLIITTICFVTDPQETVNEAWRVLERDGSLVMGLIDKESFLGKKYNSHKEESKFYHSARFFSVPEALGLLSRGGWMNIAISQTLFDLPELMTEVQAPRKGYGEGAFVVVVAVKADMPPEVRTGV